MVHFFTRLGYTPSVLSQPNLAKLTIGQPAPNFTLADLHGQSHSLSEYRGQIVVIDFWSAECPWVRRADGLLAEWSQAWGRRVSLLPIAANASEPMEMIMQAANDRDLTLVLHDVTHRIADLYGASNTPHFFVVDELGLLRYQGGLDDVTFRQRTATRFYLREAVEALLAGRNPPVTQTTPYGCTIVRFS